MAGDEVICRCRDVSYLDMRKTIKGGARALDEIVDQTGAATYCGECTSQVQVILDSICGYDNVSLKDVVNAINNGADTVEKVGELAKAGSTCGGCRRLIENIVELKR